MPFSQWLCPQNSPFNMSIFFSSNKWKKLIQSRGRSFIFSTSIPVPIAAAAHGIYCLEYAQLTCKAICEGPNYGLLPFLVLALMSNYLLFFQVLWPKYSTFPQYKFKIDEKQMISVSYNFNTRKATWSMHVSLVLYCKWKSITMY